MSTPHPQAVKPTRTPHNEKGHASFGHCPKCEEKTTAQHTLTPWELDINEDAIWLCSGEKILGSITDITKEDATFIVRAVNSHEILLQLVKDWERMIPQMSDHTPAEDSLRARSLRAIAQAEGKE